MGPRDPAMAKALGWISLTPNEFNAPGQWKSASGDNAYGNTHAWYNSAYYELEPEEVAYLDELAERLASWRARPIGTVALHGDFWPGNIYLADDGLRVIDWSGFRERDASYHDLFNFLGSFVVVRGTVDARTVYYGHQSEGDSLLLPPAGSGWLQEIAAAFADQYIRRLELDRDMVQLLLPMYYVAMATRREPVNEASVAVNHKFRGLLGAYIRQPRAAGGFSLPGPGGAGDVRRNDSRVGRPGVQHKRLGSNG